MSLTLNRETVRNLGATGGGMVMTYITLEGFTCNIGPFLSEQCHTNICGMTLGCQQPVEPARPIVITPDLGEVNRKLDEILDLLKKPKRRRSK